MKLWNIFLFCSFFSVANAQPSNVLFIGNSYTHMNYLFKIYQNLASSKGKKVIVDTLAVSGSSLKGHALRENTYKKMKASNWDYVFIQGYSRELAKDSATIVAQTIPYAQQLIDSLKKYNPCINIFYYMTWGYAEGFKDSIPDDSYELMQERIRKGYLQLSEATGKLPVAPVGMVWKHVREKYPELNLYTSDNSHPSPYGSYIAACTFYTAIYKESPVDGAFPKQIDATIAKNIQKATAGYVLSYYRNYNLDRDIDDDKEFVKSNFNVKEKWLSISISNYYSTAEQYFWEFGDGNTSNKKNPKHYYSKPGIYSIILHTRKGCNWFKMKKTITVSDKIKHASQTKKSQKN